MSISPVPAGVDPAFWEPSATQINEIQSADLIIRNGAQYEKWSSYATLPRARTVLSLPPGSDLIIRRTDTPAHRHGPEGAHAHGDVAFTTWLDPTIAQMQAQAVHEAMSRTWPEFETQFRRNAERLQQMLKEVDQQLETAGNWLAGAPLLASHPVYQYLERRLNWSMTSFLFEPDKLLSADEWVELEQMVETTGAKIMVWEAMPLEETRHRLRQLDVEIIVFETGAGKSDVNFLEVMRNNITRLSRRYP